MSDAGSPEPVTVTTDGVTVRKVLERDRFSTPAVSFLMQSDRDEPVVLRLVDPLPDEAELDEVGFHPEYGSQFWTAETDRLTFEYRLESGEEYETVYGLRADDPTQFMAEFSLEATAEDAAGGIQDVSDVVSAADSQAVRDLIAGSEDAAASDADVTFEADAGGDPVEASMDSPTIGTEAGASDDEPTGVESMASGGDPGDEQPDDEILMDRDDESELDADDETTIGEIDDEPQPARPAESDAEMSVDDAVDDLLGGEMPDGPESADTDESGDDPVAGDETAPTDELLAEDSSLDDGEIDTTGIDEDTAVSEAADAVLGPSVDSTDSVDSAPSTDSPEPSVGDEDTMTGVTSTPEQSDEDGLVAALAAEIRSGDIDEEDLDTLTKALNQSTPSLDLRVRYLQNEMTDLAAYTDALEEFIDEHGNATGLLSELRDGLSSVEDRLSSLETRLSDGLESLSTVEDRVDSLDDRLADRAEEAETLEDEIADVQSSLRSVRETLSEVDDLQDDLGSVEEEISSLHGDVHDIEDDIDAIKEFRDRFRTVFAGEETED